MCPVSVMQVRVGDTFAVLDSHGDIGVSAGGTDSIFHD